MRGVRGDALLAGALGASTAGLVGAASGGYFATTWGWIALCLLWAAGLALALRSAPEVTRAEAALLAALSGLLAWTLASVSWAPSADEPVREAERLLVYVSVALAAPLVVRQRREAWLLGGLLAGITAACLYGLGTRLFPARAVDVVSGARLAEPVSYWNALGIFAVLGILIAFGVVGDGRSAWSRGLAGATLVVLSATVYFTFSRGAWLALGVGLVAMFALSPARLRTGMAALVAALAPALGVWLASRASVSSDLDLALDVATAEGRELALALLVLALLAAALTVGAGPLAARLLASRRTRRALSAAAAASVGIAFVLTVFAIGNPVQRVVDAYDEFRAPPPPTPENLNARLFTVSSSWRYQQWQVAWQVVEENPVLGSGAGTYERYWLRDRPIYFKARDAHSLYLETLAELGPVGLALLLLALGIPAVAAVRARRQALVPAALGAYVAYLFHAGVDWDWEMPAVTLTALLCGAAILVSARPERVPSLSVRARSALLLLILPLMAVAFVGQIGNNALAASEDASNRRTAVAEARKAIRWAPWSANAIEQLGEAQFEYGSPKAARKTFLRALEKNPDDWDLWFDVAIVSDGQPLRYAVARASELNPLDPELVALRQALALQDKAADATP